MITVLEYWTGTERGASQHPIWYLHLHCVRLQGCRVGVSGDKLSTSSDIVLPGGPGDGVVRPLDTLDGVRLLGVEVTDVLDPLRRRSLRVSGTVVFCGQALEPNNTTFRVELQSDDPRLYHLVDISILLIETETDTSTTRRKLIAHSLNGLVC